MKNAVKKAAATTAGVGKSLAFYAKNTVHKPKEGTADYTRYYSMQAKMHNTMADAFDTGAKVAKVALVACVVTEVVLVSIWAAPVVVAASQAAGAWVAAHTAGVAASGTASAVGGATVRELADGEFEDEKNIVRGVQQTADLLKEYPTQAAVRRAAGGVPYDGLSAHHRVLQGSSYPASAASRTMLVEEWGIPVNSLANVNMLPTASHQVMHTHAYQDQLYGELLAAKDAGWSTYEVIANILQAPPSLQ